MLGTAKNNRQQYRSFDSPDFREEGPYPHNGPYPHEKGPYPHEKGPYPHEKGPYPDQGPYADIVGHRDGRGSKMFPQKSGQRNGFERNGYTADRNAPRESRRGPPPPQGIPPPHQGHIPPPPGPPPPLGNPTPKGRIPPPPGPPPVFNGKSAGPSRQMPPPSRNRGNNLPPLDINGAQYNTREGPMSPRLPMETDSPLSGPRGPSERPRGRPIDGPPVLLDGPPWGPVDDRAYGGYGRPHGAPVPFDGPPRGPGDRPHRGYNGPPLDGPQTPPEFYPVERPSSPRVNGVQTYPTERGGHEQRKAQDLKDYIGATLENQDTIASIQEILPGHPLYEEYLAKSGLPVKEKILYEAQEPRHKLSREEYNDAVERNLHVWGEWRRDLNDDLIERGRPDVPPLERMVHMDTPFDGPAERALRDPVTLMKYSVGVNQVTDLPNDEFLQFGIPRANMDHQNHELRDVFKRQSSRNDNVVNEQLASERQKGQTSRQSRSDRADRVADRVVEERSDYPRPYEEKMNGDSKDRYRESSYRDPKPLAEDRTREYSSRYDRSPIDDPPRSYYPESYHEPAREPGREKSGREPIRDYSERDFPVDVGYRPSREPTRDYY